MERQDKPNKTVVSAVSGVFQPLYPPQGGHAGMPPKSNSKPNAKAKAKGPGSWLRATLRVTLLTGFVAVLGLSLLTYLWLRELNVFNITPEQLSLITAAKPTDNSLVFDRSGHKIGELFSSYHINVSYEQLPKSLVQAILAIEDRSFWQHQGFDAKGIARAAYAHLRGSGGNQGASTLTQQVVRNFLLPSERSMQRKVQEVALAIQLEKVMTKEQIFTVYANAMFLGNGAYGVGAAAYRYFGKSVESLQPEESALIAGLFQSPSRYNPTRYGARAKQRQLQVIKAMVQAKMLSSKVGHDLAQRPLVYHEYHPANAATAPYFIDYVKEQAAKLLGAKGTLGGQGLRIYTTLDDRLQKLAEAGINQSATQLDQTAQRTAEVKTADGKVSKATLEAALISVDPRTGEILAMVGGRDYHRSQFNRTYQSLRSPGSAFKPVVYAQALQQHWKWSDVIFVSPITIQNYRPHTPDEDFGKETTLLRAFFRSMNTPTVELGQRLGLNNVLQLARRFGMRSPLKEEFGTLLGSSDATMLDMARMYSTFANAGKLVEQVAINRIESSKGEVLYSVPTPAERSLEVVSPQIAFLMTQGMRAVLQMGTGSAAAHLSGVAAGKTGTSNESTDNWFCGYAPNLATVVWVGTDEHAQIYGDVTGGKLALPIWDHYMTAAFKTRAPAPFTAPSGIVTNVVHPRYGNVSPGGVRMYFLKGYEPATDSSALEVLSQSEGSGYRDVFIH